MSDPATHEREHGPGASRVGAVLAPLAVAEAALEIGRAHV